MVVLAAVVVGVVVGVVVVVVVVVVVADRSSPELLEYYELC
ncbi:hypothetical protein N8701_01985 [bacterium]|nr:hypothetical protein [bacterium]